MRCDLGTLASGAQVTFQVIVEPRVVGSLRNTVTVTSSVTDPNPANNTASVQTTVTTSGALSATSLESAETDAIEGVPGRAGAAPMEARRH